VLVPRKKYSKTGVFGLHGRSDNRRGFTIFFFNPYFRILLARTSKAANLACGTYKT